MYAHRITRKLNGLTVQLELPEQFADCAEAEIIVLPLSQKSEADIPGPADGLRAAEASFSKRWLGKFALTAEEDAAKTDYLKQRYGL